jgi:SAM-dependent methyltransferase
MAAPNRVLNLAEISTPGFQKALARMDTLLARETVSYLHPSKRWEYPWALERAALSPGTRVLDTGCGASIFPIYLADQGYRVSAIDLQPPFGLDARHGLAVEYVQGDLCRLPWPDASFDAVFCISVIEHLGHGRVEQALKEMRRVLKPGALLLLTTDYYERADATLWYEGPGESFAVDWGFFDEPLLQKYFLNAEGFRVDGEMDLTVDWPETHETMRRFHGYPYTSVGIALRKGIE